MKTNVQIRSSEGVVETRTQETQNVRAAFVPSTFNEESRTVDVVIATDSDVIRRTWEGPIIEILDCDKGSVRTDYLTAGISVLDNHNRWGEVSETVLGVIENPRFEPGKIVGTCRFSARESLKDFIQDVKDGIIRHCSVGYDVHEYTITEKEGEITTYRATDWTPKEVSFVPVPADVNSSVRSENSEFNLNANNNSKAMSTENTDTTRAAAAEQTPAAAPAPAAAAAPAPAATDDTRAAAQADFTQRSAEITTAVRAAGFEDAVALDMIQRGIGVDAARKEILEKMAANQQSSATRSAASVNDGNAHKRAELMSNALEHRADSSVKLEDGAREYRGMSLLRMAEEVLHQDGLNVRGMSQREIATTALGLTRGVGYQSSSDFPIILGNTIDRRLRAEYESVPSLWRQFATRSDAVDFRDKSTARTNMMVGDFEKVLEGGEYKYDKGAEQAEKWKVEKYGKIIAITWESIINDDLGAFNKIPAAIARRAKQKQDNIVWDILLNNAKLSTDGKAIFHADHKNLATAGAALSIESLQAGRMAFRTQKDTDGKTTLNLAPKFLVVGPANELAAYQLTSSAYTPVTAGTVNPTYNTNLIVIVDARITDNSWYLIGDPNQVDTIEYGFLQGEGELFTERRIGFDVDGVETKARMVFGAAPIDFRGFYKNPGQ